MAETVTRSMSSAGAACARAARVRRRRAEKAAWPAGEKSSRSSSWPGMPMYVAAVGLSSTVASRKASAIRSTSVRGARWRGRQWEEVTRATYRSRLQEVRPSPPPRRSAGERGRAPAVGADGHRRPHQPGAVGPGGDRRGGWGVGAGTGACRSEHRDDRGQLLGGGAAAHQPQPRAGRVRGFRGCPQGWSARRLTAGCSRASWPAASRAWCAAPAATGRRRSGCRTAGSPSRRSRGRPRRRGWPGCPRTR